MDQISPRARCRHAPATRRNRDAILAVLERVLPPQGLVLEVASGTGEHADYFAPRLAPRRWQPSDLDPEALDSISGYRSFAAGCRTFLPPLALDVTAPHWPLEAADAIVAVNLLHIAPWAAVVGLMAGAGRVLPADGLLFLYGPFKRNARHTAPSNERFDDDLRAQNPAWGVRDLGDVISAAGAQGLALSELVEMPANNLSVVFVKI